MHTTNYRQTLILPSPDCPAVSPQVPAKPGTLAALQHERLARAPYRMTSDELLFGIFADRQNIAPAERDAARDAYFSKGQACLRASPLVKTYGWALHHDGEGRVALVEPGSDRFEELMACDDVAKVAGMRSKRM